MKKRILAAILGLFLLIPLISATILSDNTSTFTGNINMTGYNLTGSNIFANVNWSYIQNIPSYVKDWNSSGLIINWSKNVDLSNYFNKSTYYSNMTSYVTSLPISTFTNDVPYAQNSSLSNYILLSNEGKLNVNSSVYWNGINSFSGLDNKITLDWNNITNKVPSDFNYKILSNVANITDFPTSNSYFTNGNNYYNSSNFNISDYILNSTAYATFALNSSLSNYYPLNNPYGFYNSSDFNISNYALNSSLSNYFTKSQITGFNYFNKTGDNYLYSTGNTLYTNLTTFDDRYANGNVIFYLFNDSSGISTYKVMNRTVNDYPLQTYTRSLVTNNQDLVDFVNPTTNITFLSKGIFEVHLDAYDPLGKNKAGLYAKIYKRDSSGTETLIGTTKNSSILTGTVNHYVLDGSLTQDVEFNKTDYLVLKVYSYTIGTGSSVTFELEDNTNSRLTFNSNANVASPYYAKANDCITLSGNTFSINNSCIRNLQSATAPIVYNSTSGIFSLNQTGIDGSKINNDLSWITWSQATNGTLALTSALSNYYPLSNPYGYYNSSDFLISDYFTKSQILGFGYYNASSFDINNYYLKSNPYGFYNSSDFVISDYYLKSNPFNFYNSTTIPNFALNSTLSTVAFTGNYNDLTNLPTIPTNNNQLINGNGYYNSSNFNITDYYTQTSANATFVKKSGDTMTGNLNMNSNNVTSVDCVVFSNGGKWCSA